MLGSETFATPSSGSVTKGGVKAGLCPANTVQGALNTATRGNWKGSFSSQYKEYFITGILGNVPNPKKAYYEIFVNHVAASAGACELTIRAGENILFAAVPDTGKAQTPLALTETVVGPKLTAKVVGYNAKGKASALKGATVKLGNETARTGANGTAVFDAPSTRTVLSATDTGYIRDETTVVGQSTL